MAQADDIERLVSLMVRMHQSGRARELRRAAYGPADAGLGFLAKASGCTPDQVRLFESGQLQPATGQGLAWLSALYDAQPTSAQQGRSQRLAAHAAEASEQAARTVRRLEGVRS
jgi:hypothetical protein